MALTMRTQLAMGCALVLALMAATMVQPLEGAPMRANVLAEWGDDNMNQDYANDYDYSDYDDNDDVEAEFYDDSFKRGKNPTTASPAWVWISDKDVKLGANHLKQKYPKVSNWDAFFKHRNQQKNSVAKAGINGKRSMPQPSEDAPVRANALAGWDNDNTNQGYENNEGEKNQGYANDYDYSDYDDNDDVEAEFYDDSFKRGKNPTTASPAWVWVPDKDVKLGLAHLKKKYPQVNWDAFFEQRDQQQNSVAGTKEKRTVDQLLDN